MPPEPTPTQDPAIIEQKMRDLDERYIIGMQNLALASQQAKMNKIQAWNNTDKLVNDFFTFSLITLGLMATVLTAKNNIIGNKPIFYLALALQAFVVIFSSIVRLYIDGHSATTGNKVFEEFSNRLNKVDTYRIAMTNTDESEKTRVRAEMASAFAPEYEFQPKDSNWMLKNGQKAIVAIFVIAFLLFIISLVVSIKINT